MEIIKCPCRVCPRYRLEFPKCYRFGCDIHKQYVQKIPHQKGRFSNKEYFEKKVLTENILKE